jgi:pyruvate kinase
VPIWRLHLSQRHFTAWRFCGERARSSFPFVNSLEEMIEHVDKALMRSDVVQVGDQVVLVCGFPVGAVRPPNMALLHTVGE